VEICALPTSVRSAAGLTVEGEDLVLKNLLKSSPTHSLGSHLQYRRRERRFNKDVELPKEGFNHQISMLCI